MGNIDNTCVNAIRVLAADAVEKAKSGHPGLPLGSAAMAYELWANHLNHNGQNPRWPNRDRFILSGGHGSTLLYSLLHFFGYGLTLEDMKNFRQTDSLTPEHPEYGHTVGVEATTGPLGAGMGMAVGMAIAEAHLAAVFNKPGKQIVDHYTFALGGDGCMMEGISSEAFSLAGTLGLSKLIVLYDSNQISIEGSTDIAFRENVQKRMEAFGFQTLTVEDGNDLAAIGKAIEEAKADKKRPSFITVKTQIGYGCPAKQGKASAHGEPLGEDNVKALKENLSWPEPDKTFNLPQEVYDHFAELSKKGAAAEAEWNKLMEAYAKEYPAEKQLWDEYHAAPKADSIKANADYWASEDKPQATRNLSGECINKLKNLVPQLIGGSADLAPSNKTYMKDAGDFSAENYAGRNLHFGVRELAMAAMANGITLHGGLRTYVGTFFVFSDYIKPMVRLAALMKIPVTYVLTHDSIGVGEDGPTHEPIEQLAMLRAQPNLHVFRPADATETKAAWFAAITSAKTPTALVLTRQNLPQLPGSDRDKALRGAYVVSEAKNPATMDGILIGTGSEVQLCLAAQETLAKENIDLRVVSMPCMDVFAEQDEAYREEILPGKVRARVAVEAAGDFGWGKYVGLDGATVTMSGFGASGPAGQLFKKFGFTAEHVAEVARQTVAKGR
ncbi:MAG: transketolase [Selenomonadaceae bacterium]|nr:transketolase [Selenomonadaceae bacterium]